MALPMVHLSVAHGLVCAWGYRPTPAFYLGSIAPDAIHMRPGIDSQDKRAVHLSQDGQIDLRRVQELVTECWQTSGDAPFAEGYCVHLLTDRYWVDETVRPLQAKLDPMPWHEQRTLYYDECDKIDLELYDQQPWRDSVWALLQSAETSDFRGLLAQGEIEMWRDRVLRWFDRNRHKGNYPSRHITKERVLSFIDDASARAGEQMERWRRSICARK
jgi:hypothetical protein